MTDAEAEEWWHKKLEIAVKSGEKLKRELIAKNERLSERLNELQKLFPLREIPAPTNDVNESCGKKVSCYDERRQN